MITVEVGNWLSWRPLVRKFTDYFDVCICNIIGLLTGCPLYAHPVSSWLNGGTGINKIVTREEWH